MPARVRKWIDDNPALAAIVGILLLLLLIILLWLLWLWLHLNRTPEFDVDLGDNRPPFVGGENILLVGLDCDEAAVEGDPLRTCSENDDEFALEDLATMKADDFASTGVRSDVIMVLHVSEDGSKAQVVSIPRDSYVEVDGHGFIAVDKQMRTNVEHIFAIGDIVGQPLYAALAELPRARVDSAELPPVVELLAATGLCASRSAARRAVEEGGAYLNNQRVIGRKRLADADTLKLGDTLVVFCDPASSSQSEPTVTSIGPRLARRLTPAQRRLLLALCRPCRDGDFVAPASNPQIAEELHITVDSVKSGLQALFELFGIGDLPQNQKRAQLAVDALQTGVISRRELQG